MDILYDVYAWVAVLRSKNVPQVVTGCFGSFKLPTRARFDKAAHTQPGDLPLGSLDLSFQIFSVVTPPIHYKRYQ